MILPTQPPTQRRFARAMRAGGPEVIEVSIEELPVS